MLTNVYALRSELRKTAISGSMMLLLSKVCSWLYMFFFLQCDSTLLFLIDSEQLEYCIDKLLPQQYILFTETRDHFTI